MDSSVLCPCCSGQEYQHCCKPFHTGNIAKTAPLLMKSRYSAYALNLADYIMETTHPANPHYMNDAFSWRRAIARFSQNTVFHRMEVLDSKENDTFATVTFIAHLSQGNEDATYTEKSYFEKKNGRWLYRSGEIAQGQVPNLVTEGELRLLPLAYYGDPVLRQQTSPVISITEEVKELVLQMIETMDAFDGIGLAAPQVHRSLRLFVMRKPIEENQERISKGNVEVFINPTLSDPSTKMRSAPEGCISIPAIRFPVNRPEEITVTYTNLEGQVIQRRCSGWEAKVIFHEVDHLEGILFIDHLHPKDLAKITPLLQALEKRFHDRGSP